MFQTILRQKYVQLTLQGALPYASKALDTVEAAVEYALPNLSKTSKTTELSWAASLDRVQSLTSSVYAEMNKQTREKVNAVAETSKQAVDTVTQSYVVATPLALAQNTGNKVRQVSNSGIEWIVQLLSDVLHQTQATASASKRFGLDTKDKIRDYVVKNMELIQNAILLVQKQVVGYGHLVIDRVFALLPEQYLPTKTK